MRGFVPTPHETVDVMVELLFKERHPRPADTVLDPGCGTGEFIDGIIRWCERQSLALPGITGIELDPRHLPVLRTKYERHPLVRIQQADFLTTDRANYDFIIGNPPYVAITGLSEQEKKRYRVLFATAFGRFDLYLLFFEQALRSLAPRGRLVFITPEKFVYVETAGPLRNLLAERHIEEIRFIREDTFGEFVTYPTITVVRNAPPAQTRVKRRDESLVTVRLPPGRKPWLPLLEGSQGLQTAVTLKDLCLRISCGIATGADSVFVRPQDDLDPALQRFGHPTLAGRELSVETNEIPHRFVMLIPYDEEGRLLPFARLGALGRYLMREDTRKRLLARTCVKRKPWYAFHETPRLSEILRPKILCKDIGETPHFWIDRSGEIVPRHSLYYLVPRNPAAIDAIVEYLQSPAALEWLRRNCQRASKGFLRLQSHVLQRLPVPDRLVKDVTSASTVEDAGRLSGQRQLAFMR